MLAFPAQADIFSLGIVLFELFLRKTMAALIMEGDYDPGLVEMFAYKVHQRTNEGYITPHVPPLTMIGGKLQSLICQDKPVQQAQWTPAFCMERWGGTIFRCSLNPLHVRAHETVLFTSPQVWRSPLGGLPPPVQ